MRSYVPADASGVLGWTMTGTSVWFADLNEHSEEEGHIGIAGKAVSSTTGGALSGNREAKG